MIEYSVGRKQDITSGVQRKFSGVVIQCGVHMAHSLLMLLCASTSVLPCFCFESSEVSLVCVLLIISCAVVSFFSAQLKDKGAMNSNANLKHQGQVIIKIYDATESLEVHSRTVNQANLSRHAHSVAIYVF